MKYGSLFSGIGGIDLGLDRAGFECAWQVERDPYCLQILSKHWPTVPKYTDIKEVNFAEVEPVELLAGGFPCQPHSLAGKRRGSADERDLWGEFARAIRQLRPRWVVAENVPGILSSEGGRYFGRVLQDLAALGYDAEWDCIPAAAFGAPHLRYRVVIVAHTASARQPERVREPGGEIRDEARGPEPERLGADVADALGAGLEIRQELGRHAEPEQSPAERGSLEARGLSAHWATEPNVGRVANGVPHRVDRLRALGNAVVPQMAEWIGRRIMEATRR